jgi:hypothetical protein
VNIRALKQGAPVKVSITVGDYEWTYTGTLDESRRDSSLGIQAVDDPYDSLPEDLWLSPVVMVASVWDLDVRLRVRRTEEPLMRITERGETARQTLELLELQERHRREREAGFSIEQEHP